MSQLQHARSFRDLIRSLSSELAEVGQMLNSMIEKSASFCGELPFTLHESALNYFTTSDD